MSPNLQNFKIPTRPHRIGDRPLAILDALYGDPLVPRLHDEHGVEHHPEAGTLADRFGSPQASNIELVSRLYIEAGLTKRQVELVTGIA